MQPAPAERAAPLASLLGQLIITHREKLKEPWVTEQRLIHCKSSFLGLLILKENTPSGA